MIQQRLGNVGIVSIEHEISMDTRKLCRRFFEYEGTKNEIFVYKYSTMFIFLLFNKQK